MNIVGRSLARPVAQYAAKVALVDGDLTFTYRELDGLVRKVAAGIRSLGIEPGDRISYHGNNRWELVVTLLASIRAGTVLVPLNVMLRPAELVPILAETKIRLVLTTSEGEGTFGELKESALYPEWVSSYDDTHGLFAAWIRAEEAEGDPAARAPTDIVALFFTSGPPGHPKGPPLDHIFIDHLAHSWVMACRYTHHEIFLVATPMFWVVAPIHVILPIVLVGGTIFLMRRFDPERCCKLVKQWKVTSFFAVPTMYTLLLDSQASALPELESLRVCSVAGAPIARDVVERFEKLTGAPLLNIYGATEAGGISRDLLGVPRRAGCAGPWGGTVEAKIVNAEGNPVPAGVPGEIVARGLTVIRGYWRGGKVDDQSLPDGWFHTGDIGVVEDGFVRILDRAQDMIITGGANIYPAEVEAVLAKHPKVGLAAVVGVPDRVKGEIAVAYVILKQPGPPTAEELEAHCREHLSSYKVPKKFLVVQSLPMTPTGKIQKRELRRMAADSFGGG